MNTFNKTLSRVTLVLGVTFMSAFQLYADDWKIRIPMYGNKRSCDRDTDFAVV